MSVDTEELGLFGMLLRSSVDGIVLNDRDSEWFLEVSDSFEELTGYRRSELIGRTSLEVGLYETGEGQVRASAWSQAHSGLAGMYETKLRRKDGSRVWVEFSQQLLGDRCVLTVARDVTDHKRVEQALRVHAELDELTGIYNRRRFQEEVEKHLRGHAASGTP